MLLDKLKARLASHQRPLRFLIGGGINTLIGISMFPLIVWLSPWLNRNYMVALVMSQVICTFIAFVTYRFGVFSSSGRGFFREFFVFASFYVTNYVVNWISLPILVNVFGVKPAYAQVFFALVVAVTSYFWHSRVTFKQTLDKQPLSE